MIRESDRAPAPAKALGVSGRHTCGVTHTSDTHLWGDTVAQRHGARLARGGPHQEEPTLPAVHLPDIPFFAERAWEGVCRKRRPPRTGAPGTTLGTLGLGRGGSGREEQPGRAMATAAALKKQVLERKGDLSRELHPLHRPAAADPQLEFLLARGCLGQARGRGALYCAVMQR